MTAVGTQLVTAFLAAPPTPPPGRGPEWGKAAPIGLLVIVLMGIGLFLLIKSMNRHMRNVAGRTSFDTPETQVTQVAQDSQVTRGTESVVTRTRDEPARTDQPTRTDIRSDADPTP